MRENLDFFLFFSSKFSFCLTPEFFDFFHLSFLTREKKLSCVCLFLCALLRILTLSLIRDSY